MSKKLVIFVSLALITGLVVFIAGCTGGTATVEKTETTKQVDPPAKTGTEGADKDSPIAKVDFKNFAFPVKTADAKEQTVTLKDGKAAKTAEMAGATLGNILYADVTGDKASEAIIDVAMEGEKDAKTTMVYVYTLENEKPKLLWSFETAGGDKTGLKAITADKGNLMVEMFGDVKFVKGVFETAATTEKGKYTKTQLKWNGKEFAVEGSPEVLDIESKA